MAGADPRRSSRARLSQTQSQISSTSSSTSGRTERNTRSFNKGGSPQKSTPPGSLSSEAEETITAEDSVGTRRRTRGQGEERDKVVAKSEDFEMANGDDDIQEEDEAVRCICGYDDYPGPPPFDEDTKQGVKDAIDVDPIFRSELPDDAAGFFVQCDICKVWQHGACVGIMTEESSPDEYFCEECRKDLHKIYTASNGQRYSHYLPLKRHSRTASRSTSLNKERAPSPPKEKESRSGRAASSNQSSKRRSTMNSREAAYDEAEALRRAIEESKEEALHDHDGSSRRTKRGRSNSEEKQDSAKRQRTSSRSLSPSFDKAIEDSDDAATITRNGSLKTKPRASATTRNQRAEKFAEKEERDRQRAEAANKRKGRAERRRADGTTSTPASTILVKVSEAHVDTDSDPSEELPLAARAAAARIAVATSTVVPAIVDVVQPPVLEPPPSSQPTPDTPTVAAVAARNDKKRSHKKKGRNQHTRDRDGHEEGSPARSQSRDIQKDEHHSGVSKTSGDGAGKTHSRSKGGMSSKITMSEMKRRASALLDFISRTQVELAGETLAETSSEEAKVNGAASSPASDKRSQPTPSDVAAAEPNSGAAAGKDFKELNCMEMMDSLTRRLVKWQQEYSVT